MTAPDSSSVDVDLDVNDLRALGRLTAGDHQQRTRYQVYWWFRSALWAALVFASILHPIVWCAVALELGCLVVEQRARRSARIPAAHQLLNGRYAATPRGLSKTSAGIETIIAWSAVEPLSQTSQHVYLRFSGTGWVVPIRCFSSDDHRGQFVAALQRHIGSARST